jgi:predicted transcriptional regulator
MAEPDTKALSVFDLPPDEAQEARLDAEAEADIAAGRVISHERMREWLAKLAKGERVPPPEG